MKMPFGQYKGMDIVFISSGYLHYIEGKLQKQTRFTRFNNGNLELLSAIQEELEKRTRSDSHFFTSKVLPRKA